MPCRSATYTYFTLLGAIDLHSSSISSLPMGRSKAATIMAVSLSFLVCSVLLIANLLSAEPEQQYPLISIGNGAEAKEVDLIYEWVVIINEYITPI